MRVVCRDQIPLDRGLQEQAPSTPQASLVVNRVTLSVRTSNGYLFLSGGCVSELELVNGTQCCPNVLRSQRGYFALPRGSIE